MVSVLGKRDSNCSNEQARSTERFWQVDSVPGERLAGAGLSLAIYERIVEVRRVCIMVGSTPGQRSNFKFAPLLVAERDNNKDW